MSLCSKCCYDKPPVGGAEALFFLIFGADAGVSSRLCTSKGPEGPGDDLEGNLHQICTSLRNLLNIRKIPIQLLLLLIQNNNSNNKKNNNNYKIKMLK